MAQVRVKNTEIVSFSIPIHIREKFTQRIRKNERSLAITRLIEMLVNNEVVVKVYGSNGKLERIL